MPPEGPFRILVVTTSSQLEDEVRRALPSAEVAAVPARQRVPGTPMRETHPHLVIVDLDSGGPGSWMALTKDAGRPPVLGLTRRHDAPGKLAAIRIGIDDVLDIPFTADELLVRTVVLTRRAMADPAEPLEWAGGALAVDLVHRRIRVDGSELRLTGVEVSLLYLLMAHAGEIVTREQILDALWGIDFVPDSNVVERHIRALRRKLHDDWHHPRFIETVHGKGYRLISDIASVPPDVKRDAPSVSER